MQACFRFHLFDEWMLSFVNKTHAQRRQNNFPTQDNEYKPNTNQGEENRRQQSAFGTPKHA